MNKQREDRLIIITLFGGGGAHSLSHHLQRTPYISQGAYGNRGPDSQWKREESGESE